MEPSRSGQAAAWRFQEYSNCRIYSGNFAVFRRGGVAVYQVPGWIVVWAGLPTDVYLYNPPTALRELPQGPCLQLLNPGSQWFKLHWEKPARSLEESIAYVEDLLDRIPHRLLYQSLSVQQKP